MTHILFVYILLFSNFREITRSLILVSLALFVYFRILYIQHRNKKQIEFLQFAVYKNRSRLDTLEKNNKIKKP
jgi:pilus assembly protein TadC